GGVDVDPSNVVEAKSFVAADIPGLIEGASEGRGMGHEFLKHLERTKLIAYVTDPYSIEDYSVFDQYVKLNYQLGQFRAELAEKPSVVIINKIDLQDETFYRAALDE